MIIENVFFKRDAVMHARVPEEIKNAFKDLAYEKNKTASQYLLELVLKELKEEGVNLCSNAVNSDDHAK